MGVICPRCETRCDDNDLYCVACGTSLTGSRREPRSDQPEEHAQITSTPPVASISEDYTPSADERDFIPLTFAPSGTGWNSGKYRRWLLPAIGLVVLLGVGIALERWRDGGEDNDPANMPALTGGPFLASPPARSLARSASSPSPAEMVDHIASPPVPTPTMIPVSASPAAKPVAPGARSAPATPTEGAAIPTGTPTDPAGLTDALTPIDVPPGDGTGGASLVPTEGTPTPTASGD